MSVTLKSTSLRNSNFSEFICQWAERNIFWCLQGTFYAVRMWAERQSSVRFLCLHAPRNREKRPRRQNTSQALTWSLTKLFILVKLIPFPNIHISVSVSSITMIKTVAYKKIFLCRVLFDFHNTIMKEGKLETGLRLGKDISQSHWPHTNSFIHLSIPLCTQSVIHSCMHTWNKYYWLPTISKALCASIEMTKNRPEYCPQQIMVYLRRQTLIN